jgi:hypothetical protein
MNSADDHITQLEARLGSLEAARRRSRWQLAAAVLAGAGLAVTMGARQPTSVVRAERYELVDGSGDEVGVWSAAERSLTLSGPGGDVALSADRRGPSLTLSPRRGEGLTLDASSTDVGPTPARSTEPPPTEPLAAASPSTEPVRIRLDGGDSAAFSALEVVCPSNGYRERSSFQSFVAAVPAVPTNDRTCQAYLKGGPPVKISVRGGDDLHCTVVGSRASCDQVATP